MVCVLSGFWVKIFKMRTVGWRIEWLKKVVDVYKSGRQMAEANTIGFGSTDGTKAHFNIGLYLIAEIIQRHSGRIWVVIESGKCSIFNFSLPMK